MQCFVNRYLITLLRKVTRTGEAARTGADDGYLVSIGCRCFCRFGAVGIVVVRHKAFHTADADRLKLDAERALAFALALLRADTSADCRKGRSLCDDLVCFFKVAFPDLFQEIRDMDVYRTAGNTGLVFAVEAAACFCDCGCLIIAERNFIEVVCTDLRVLCRHFMFFRIECHYCASFIRLHASSRLCASKFIYMRLRDIASSKSTS